MSADDEGDASGGSITFQHIFRNQSNNFGDTNLYNIEHVMVTTQSTLQSACQLAINGMDPGTGQPATPNPVDRRYQIPLTPFDVTAGFLVGVGIAQTTVPIWVGTYSGPDTDLGDLIISLQNVDSLRVIVVVYGYFWAPGAVNAQGGIQRPANGQWRS